MKRYVFRKANYGGETYEYLRIKTNSKKVEIKNHNTLVFDDTEIEFGELLEFVEAEEV